MVYTDHGRLLEELDEWLKQPGSLHLKAGELEDSLALDRKIPLVGELVPRFADQDRHLLLLITKSTNCRNLLKHHPKGQVILGFSVNAPAVWRLYEKKTPHPLKRALAATNGKAVGLPSWLRRAR